MKFARIGLTVLAAAAGAGLAVTAPAHAAGTPGGGQILVSNSSGTWPQLGLTIKVKCPYDYPFALEGSVQGTNGAVFGPITLADYPTPSSVSFFNPNSLNSNLTVTAKLSVICSKWSPTA